MNIFSIHSFLALTYVYMHVTDNQMKIENISRSSESSFMSFSSQLPTPTPDLSRFITVLLSRSTDSFKWNHTTCNPVNLASQAQPDVYAILQYCCAYPQFAPAIPELPSSSLSDKVVAWVCLHWFIHSPVDGHLGYFQFLVIMNKDAMNVYVKVCVDLG